MKYIVEEKDEYIVNGNVFHAIAGELDLQWSIQWYRNRGATPSACGLTAVEKNDKEKLIMYDYELEELRDVDPDIRPCKLCFYIFDDE